MKIDYVNPEGKRTSTTIRPILWALLLAYLGGEAQAKEHVVKLALATPPGRSVSSYVTDAVIVELVDPRKVGDKFKQSNLV